MGVRFELVVVGVVVAQMSFVVRVIPNCFSLQAVYGWWLVVIIGRWLFCCGLYLFVRLFWLSPLSSYVVLWITTLVEEVGLTGAWGRGFGADLCEKCARVRFSRMGVGRGGAGVGAGRGGGGWDVSRGDGGRPGSW